MSSCIHVIRTRPGTPQELYKCPITRHILYPGKLRLRKVNDFARDHTAEKWQTQVLHLWVRTLRPTISPSDQRPPHLAVTLVLGEGGTLSCSRHQMGYPSLYSFGLSLLSPGKPQSLSLSPQGHGNKYRISSALSVSRGDGGP